MILNFAIFSPFLPNYYSFYFLLTFLFVNLFVKGDFPPENPGKNAPLAIVEI